MGRSGSVAGGSPVRGIFGEVAGAAIGGFDVGGDVVDGDREAAAAGADAGADEKDATVLPKFARSGVEVGPDRDFNAAGRDLRGWPD